MPSLLIVPWLAGNLPRLTAQNKLNKDYDLAGSVCRLEQRRPWKCGGLDQLSNPDSFDTVFSVAGKVLEHTDYTFAGGVYRRNRYSYDETGLLVRAVQSDGNGNEVTISEFEYLESKQICTTRSPTGVLTRRYVDEYDGQLLTVLGTYDANGSPMRLKTFEYMCGVLFKAVSKYFGPAGALAEISITRFDSFFSTNRGLWALTRRKANRRRAIHV
jgi:hypothetical protein